MKGKDQNLKTPIASPNFSVGLVGIGETEPTPDIAKCGECGWTGTTTDCDTEQDGTWEEGYYDVDLCPKCEDGGCIEYDMTPERMIEWEKWQERKAN
jgi:hypothetical protein